jgi:hypothetical protein
VGKTHVVLVVDAANVVGSRPDGWWRDRAGAAERFVKDLRETSFDEPVVVVLEGAARRGVEEGVAAEVRVVHARADGDDAIVDLARGAEHAVTVVSADRGLASRVRALGADVVGPRWLLARLASARIERAHRGAIDAGEPGYLDPDTGLFVFTAAYHRARGTCCGSGCRHCPFGGAPARTS